MPTFRLPASSVRVIESACPIGVGRGGLEPPTSAEDRMRGVLNGRSVSVWTGVIASGGTLLSNDPRVSAESRLREALSQRTLHLLRPIRAADTRRRGPNLANETHVAWWLVVGGERQPT